MKTDLHATTSMTEDDRIPSHPIKVCIHVLREARLDVRAMRAATALAEAGFAVSIVDVESDRTRPLEEIVRGIPMKHIMVDSSFNSVRFEQGTFVKAGRLFIQSIFHLLHTPADIYHACEVTALPACYLIARLRRKPLLFEAYELPLDDQPLSAMGKNKRLLHRLLATVLTYIIPRCAGVIATSPRYVQEICRFYRLPDVLLIRNVPPYQVVPKSDRLRQLLGLGSHVRIALYQGYLQPDRSLDILVRAAKFLEPDTVIVMMGKGFGTTPAQLKALVNSEGVADRVKIIPPVPYEELLNWTASADIGLSVYPPDYSLSIRFCLPNKFFEYLMAGLPVLSSQLDVLAELIRAYDVGRVVDSLAPAEVGAAINSMLADAAALSHMRHNALYAANQEFSWDKERRLLLDLYDSILVN